MRGFTFFIAFLPALLAAQTTPVEPVYRLRPVVEVPVWAAVGLGFGTERLAARGLSAFSESELQQVLLAFGPQTRRTFAQRHFSKTAAPGSDFMTGSAVGIAAFQAFQQNRQPGDRRRNTVILAEAGLLQFFLNGAVKNWAHRTRPFVFNPNVPLAEKLKLDARRSFYSGHTGMTATMTFYSAKIWTDFHPDSPRKPLVWATAVAWPMAVGYLRMRAGRHYFSDVATGFLIGAVVGWGVPALHKRLRF